MEAGKPNRAAQLLALSNLEVRDTGHNLLCEGSLLGYVVTGNDLGQPRLHPPQGPPGLAQQHGASACQLSPWPRTKAAAMLLLAVN